MVAIKQIFRNCCCKGIVRLHRYDSGPDFGEGRENIWHVRVFSDGGKAVAMSHIVSHIVCGQHCQWHLRTHSSKWWVKDGEYSRTLCAENFVVQSNAMICLGGQRHLWSCKILGVSSLTTVVYLGWPCMAWMSILKEVRLYYTVLTNGTCQTDYPKLQHGCKANCTLPLFIGPTS